MKFSTGVISLVLVLIAASSFVSMISMFRIDGIVHGDLYRYGLRFSYEWAMPYWAMTTIVFAVSWFNIIAAVAFEFYVLIFGRKEAEMSAVEREPLRTETSQELPPQPIEEKQAETQAQPTEKVEEYKEQEPRPAEKVEKEPEETQTTVEGISQQGPSETTRTEEVEGQKEQESEPPEDSEIQTKETSKPEQETDQKALEEIEEEPTTVVEDATQQVGTSVL